MQTTFLASALPVDTGHTERPARVDRLPPIDELDQLQGELTELQPPAWLTQLDAGARVGLRCLPARTRICKRVVDIFVASVLLILSLPVVVVAAVAIKLTSRGPIFFTQTRVGLNARRQQRRSRDEPGSNASFSGRRRKANFGKPFTIYKLRTMSVESSQGGPSQAKAGDSRVTWVGRILRQMRIDELPQLCNVLRGEMSMVGPRPECIEYMEELSEKIPGYLQRLGLKPGLTGIAQIEAGYANNLASYRRKVAFDLMYLQHCSVRNDLKVMLRTIRVVLTGFGAL
ncbi:MAG: sugar transferase [Pirellulaceae bacterium]